MMCSFHDKCSLTITPRSFIDDTFSILHPLMVRNRLTGDVFELGVYIVCVVCLFCEARSF